MIGRTLAHYHISAAIGAGGMGEVYRASDTKLGREVALKVLPTSLARDPDRLARFQREARAVAALNHPFIVTIYSVEETEGIHFLTMELVEGRPLAEMIPERGLPVDRIVSIGTALADALAAAHDKGIVHRDLKPANVMLTADGRVKVLDFGLAKEVRAETADVTGTLSGRTEVGVVMGTPAYMSPEQVTGRPIDHRTDIFSLGILLYEMASGRRPFQGESSIELASSILRDMPRPIDEMRADVPGDLVRLIRRCLEKDPQRRLQTARDVSNELREMGRGVTPSGATRAAEGFWIAVQPFKCAGGSADLATLAEGLSEAIITGLSRFSYLRVIAHGSTQKGARYVMEGSIRQAGSSIRVAVQLVDTTTGEHLWAETYDRQFQTDQIFAIQDDLIARIIATCADAFGVLARNISEAVRGKDPRQLTPYEALMRGFAYYQRLTPEGHAQARDALERAVEQAPANADCWAMLSWIYAHEYGHGFNVREGSLDRALAAARHAVDLAPSNALAHQALAVALFFRRDIASCLSAAERSMALNPLDADNESIHIICFTGNWDRGCALIRRAIDLNPHHPRWYELMLAADEYRKMNYRASVEQTMKANAPEVFWGHVFLAAAYGQLAEVEGARNALRDLRALKPDFIESGRDLIGRWLGAELGEHLIDGLRKAGLDLGSKQNTRPADSGGRRIDEGFGIAVLPFKHAGSGTDVGTLAEGLSDEIIAGLSKFSYLRVVGHGSTPASARYVIEGSVRQAGSQLRVVVQLIDTNTGTHLWAETYNRAFQPDAIFDLQDDLVPRIVATVADMYGVLRRSMSEVVRARGREQLTSYEAVLRGFGYYERLTPADHAEARDILEGAVQIAPDAVDCWAALSMIYTDEFNKGFNRRPDSLARALAAARRAVELVPTNQLAQEALAVVLFFRREFSAFRHAAERTIALNPIHSAVIGYMGTLLAYSGDWQRGCAIIARASELNPHHPGWYWFTPFWNAYRQRDYEAALEAAVKVNMPGYHFTHAALAAAYGQLGHREAAAAAVKQLLAMSPDVPMTRQGLEKWISDAELIERFIDGLRKAGLDVPDSR